MVFRISFVFLLICQSAYGQYLAKEQQLIQKVAVAENDSMKVIALGELADFYYIYRAENKGDSVLQRQLSIAELSDNKDLILQTFFGNAITNINNWSSSNTFDQAIAFLNKGLQYARETGNEEYEALAYLRLETIYRKKGQYDKAMEQATLALSTSTHLDNDSLRCAVFLEIGDIFLAKGNAVSAYKNYNNAFDFAYKMKNISLQSNVYHRFSSLYQSLSNKELATKNLLKSLELNRENNNEKGLLQDYKDLARMTDEETYLGKYIQLASKLKNERDVLYGKQLMFAYLMVIKKNGALQYLQENDDLKQSFLNTGLSYYYWNIGNVYRYSGLMDSAIYYFIKALPEMERNYDLAKQIGIFSGLAECYKATGQDAKSIENFEKASAIGKQKNDFNSLAYISNTLSKLYAQEGDYKKAYEYDEEYFHCKDTLQKMAAQRDVTLLEVDRENKKHEKDLQDAEALKLRTRNLQYIGITIAIAAFFTIMLLMGMFPISKYTIKLLSFFAFICLFEFVILLIDPYLQKITHEQPLKIWLIKVCLIPILVPIQHYLEKGVVAFLASQRLLRMRESLSIRKVWLYFRKPATEKQDADVEEDTAVL